MIIALASPRVASSLEESLERARDAISTAASRGAAIVCFPESYLPGLRGLDFEVPAFDATRQEEVLRLAKEWARRYRIAAILGMEWHAAAGRQIAAAVIDANGELQGVQIKCQLDPSEEAHYVPGTSRQLFEINGVQFGIAICHEGFRYPETVRWAATRGAKVVFHPHCTGSDLAGIEKKVWCEAGGPYYEKAMTCRALENTIYFASVNYAFRYPESATAIIGPGGELVAQLPYGAEGVLVQEISIAKATGLLASRFAAERYPREVAG
ncbi:MAG TPA: carbon-nitrogen hydrolase family protein [Gemmata sp.]|nr:carbon-nitrogen hydrolase family protein [Gemmata sp.]